MKTWRRTLVWAVTLGAAAVLGGCASGRGARPVPAIGLDPAAAPQKIEDVPGVNVRLFRDGRVYIGGQPDSLALRALAERGVKTVVNLRTPTEMADRKNVPYDEPALARELGLAYVSVPLGGSAFPYTPAATDSFAAVLARTTEPVFLHCTVGGRARGAAGCPDLNSPAQPATGPSAKLQRSTPCHRRRDRRTGTAER